MQRRWKSATHNMCPSREYQSAKTNSLQTRAWVSGAVHSCGSCCCQGTWTSSCLVELFPSPSLWQYLMPFCHKDGDGNPIVWQGGVRRGRLSRATYTSISRHTHISITHISISHHTHQYDTHQYITPHIVPHYDFYRSDVDHTGHRAQELCESQGGRPGLPSLISLRFRLWT